ncbi:hypothetical protein CPB86DRAFT_782831 [Serendipita vermifera]|nr:hypothetical protein CPB86DRAFT_782831 [Serendipita vermifera]
MAYGKLMDDLLLEIAAKLDYPSLMSLSQTSRRHRSILLQSKHVFLSLARNWSFSTPLSLPVHILDRLLTPNEINTRMRAAFQMDKSWKNLSFKTTIINEQAFSVQSDFPGSVIERVHYFEGPDLILFILDDAGTKRCRYLTLYTLSSRKQVIKWDVEEAEIIMGDAIWVDTGGKFKRLVIALSLQRPGWCEIETRNSLEVQTVDFDDYFRGLGPAKLEPTAKCYWRDAYTNITLSDTICGGLVLFENRPVVLTCMNWRTNSVDNILVDLSPYEPLGISSTKDFTSDVRFTNREAGAADVILIQDWLGVVQITSLGEVRCFLTKVHYTGPTVDMFPHFPSFRVKEYITAVGCNPTTTASLPVVEGAAVFFSRLRKPTRMTVLVALSSDELGEIPQYKIGKLDFERFYTEVASEAAHKPGFHALPSFGVEFTSVPEEYIPIVGNVGHAIVYMVDTDWDKDLDTLYPEKVMIRSVPEGSPTEKAWKDAELCLPEDKMGHWSALLPRALDDANGVVALEDYDNGNMWFIKFE